MKEVLEEQVFIRQYLLGNLGDKVKMRQIEEKILLDDDFNEILSIAEDNLIEEYLDNELTESEREGFAQHFLLAPEARQKLRLIQNLRQLATHEEPKTSRKTTKNKAAFLDWRKIFALPAFRFAALALLVLGLGFSIWRIAFYQSEIDRGMAQLRAAYRGKRPSEARTSANFEYEPLSATRGEPNNITDPQAFRHAELLLLDAAANKQNAKARHALGLLYLANRKYDEAIAEINAALNLTPSDARIHGDLASAFFEKAKQAEADGKYDESSKNFALSLQSLNRALEIDDSQRESLFNRALVLGKLRLGSQAREAWLKYLEQDVSSPWAEEARKNLESLNKDNETLKDNARILQDFLDAYQNRDDARAWEIVSQTKELITDAMVQSQLAMMFLEASRQNRQPEAEKFLSAFFYLGELEKKNSGDPYFAELAGFYRRSGQTEQLLDAHRALRQGHQLMLVPNFKQAVEVLETAKSLFQATGNIWESDVAEYQIAYCLSRVDRIKESNERLSELSKTAEQRDYKWIRILADGWIGETYFFLGEPSKAAAYNRKSLALAERISDNYNSHRILVQLTEEAKVIGEKDRALFFTYRNLIFRDTYYTSPRQRWRDLNYAAEVFQRFKLYDAAAAFAEESTYLAENEVKDDWMIRTSRRNLAVIYGRLRKFPKAYEQAEETFQISRRFKDEAMRRRLVANSWQTLADLQAQEGKCAAAAENYDRAIDSYQELKHVTYEYTARKGRLLCNITEGSAAGIGEELTVLLRQFDQNREKITNEADRITYFDAEQEVYDAAIDYAHSKLKDPAQAFYFAENSRARGLLQLTGNSRIQPFQLSEIRKKIPLEAQILYYAVLADKILIWRISRDEVNVAEKLIPAGELDTKVQRYLELLTGKTMDDEINSLAKELFELLISPLGKLLKPDQILCLVADKILFRLPFASLISPETNSYLIETHPLISAPSATIFINETDSAKQKESIAEETILSVGNPAFSRKEYPDLEDLPSAGLEAKEIASLYDPAAAKVFTGTEATKSQLISNLNSADVVHFAGHYVPNSKTPALSRFLLAADELQVGEINEEKLTRVRLLILSGCETGVERYYRGEGMIGATRAFLAAGVPLVVASQWAVESEATAGLMVKFHRHRKKENLLTAAALQQAQIDMITGESTRFRQPYYWAGFSPIGGYTNY